MDSVLSRVTAKVVIGAIGLGGFVAIGVLLIFRPDTAHGEMVFQSFNAIAVGIFGYYFGSSAGSAQKSDTIAQHLERLSPAPSDNPPASKMPPLSASGA